jgi:hypothetical protein
MDLAVGHGAGSAVACRRRRPGASPSAGLDIEQKRLGDIHVITISAIAGIGRRSASNHDGSILQMRRHELGPGRLHQVA